MKLPKFKLRSKREIIDNAITTAVCIGLVAAAYGLIILIGWLIPDSWEPFMLKAAKVFAVLCLIWLFFFDTLFKKKRND